MSDAKRRLDRLEREHPAHVTRDYGWIRSSTDDELSALIESSKRALAGDETARGEIGKLRETILARCIASAPTEREGNHER